MDMLLDRLLAVMPEQPTAQRTSAAFRGQNGRAHRDGTGNNQCSDVSGGHIFSLRVLGSFSVTCAHGARMFFRSCQPTGCNPWAWMGLYLLVVAQGRVKGNSNYRMQNPRPQFQLGKGKDSRKPSIRAKWASVVAKI